MICCINLSSMHSYNSSGRKNLYLRPVFYSPFECDVQAGGCRRGMRGFLLPETAILTLTKYVLAHVAGVNLLHST